MTLRAVFADDSYLVRVAVSALLSQGDEIELITASGTPTRWSGRWPSIAPMWY